MELLRSALHSTSAAVHWLLDTLEAAGQMRTDQPSSKTESAWSVAPFWKVPRPEPKPLTVDEECDTAIVGGGITGLAIARSLCDEQRVIVLDSRQIGEGSTGWCAGILALSTTLDLDQVELQLGNESAREIAFFLADAINKMHSFVRDLGDDWQTGKSMYVSARKPHERLLRSEFETRHRFGLDALLWEPEYYSKVWSGFQGGLELTGDHAVHPARLLLSLAASIEAHGSLVCENSPVSAWIHQGEHFIVTAAGRRVKAQNLILCPGVSSALFPQVQRLDRSCIPVTSHILVTQPSEEIAAIYKKQNCIALWDSLQLYHYVRYLPSGRVLVGGEEYPGATAGTVVSNDDPAIQRLHSWAMRHHVRKMPPVEFAWKAGLALPADGLPLMDVQSFGENILIAAVTDGLPFSFLLGHVVSSLIKEGKHPLAPLLMQRRKMPLDAKLLSALPAIQSLRDAAYQTAFAGLHLRDKLF